MVEELAERVAGLSVPASGHALAQAHRLRDALDARIAEAEAAYARDGGFEVDGFPTMAAFLRDRAHLSPRRRGAGRRERRASGTGPRWSRRGRAEPSPGPGST